MAKGTAVEAVTFDYWNTLCCEPPGGYLRGRRLEAMGRVMGDAGVGDAGVVLAAAYDAAWLEYVAGWEANTQYTGRHAARRIADAVHRHYGLGNGVREQLFDAFASASRAGGAELKLIDGLTGALSALRDLGVPLAIVCDVGFTPSPELRLHLEHHGLLGYFDAWAFSDEVGVYKPDKRIFEHALDGLGSPDPSHCAHVGDRRRTDIAGAQALGMRAVRITTVFDDHPDQGPSGDAVVTSYEELLPALGLA
ncbi:MAG: HAD family hydrolase [Actinomycetota bacterium]|nr:HAD family hydrolase [Actinomycetota bacterium]